MENMVMVNIELKNVKILESQSQETFCFEATMYVDGERLCRVTNGGYGGPNDYQPLPKAPAGAQNILAKRIQEIEHDLKQYVVPCSFDPSEHLTLNLELVVGDELNRYQRDKQIKKMLRNIAYVRPNGDVYTLPSKHKPTPENLKKVQTAPFWKKEFKLLNQMPMDEVRALDFFKIAEHEYIRADELSGEQALNGPR
jgi:hypothetical protein